MAKYPRIVSNGKAFSQDAGMVVNCYMVLTKKDKVYGDYDGLDLANAKQILARCLKTKKKRK